MKILIVEDHHIFRESMVTFLKEQDFIESVDEADSGEKALKLLAANSFDIIIMDLSLPGISGLEASEKVKEKHPQVKILVLTMHDTLNYVRDLLKIGVEGYLFKTTNLNELVEALQKISHGETFYGAEVQQAFMEGFKSGNVSMSIQLTGREKEILDLICQEYSTSGIAEKLFISTHTVESHRKNLMAKTGSKNVVGLVKFAIENKIFG